MQFMVYGWLADGGVMEKAVAARILDAALSLGNEIGKLDSLISELDSGREKEELVQALGNIMGVLTQDVVFRIVRDHPELDPDR
jgi:hypothetical protein